MILSKQYEIINNDPDGFGIRYNRHGDVPWNVMFPQLFLKAFEENLKAHSDSSFRLSQFHLEIFATEPIKTDLYTESMVYHLESSFVKLHAYLYAEKNVMVAQASAQYVIKK